LKNEVIRFFNWYAEIYTEFHDFKNIESRSISDKIGTEILECSITYYDNSAMKKAGNPPELIWCDYLILIQA
jgi:hypothetical protein